ncbi:MAG: hypothetical protein JWN32_4042 [Solirubrobacterales bacterium]|jgi:hypothetical protein|nr:hypothetical protein [Solirubrobacterales bacterium]
MADARYRYRYLQILIDHIAEDRFPSHNQMNIIESLLRPEEMDAYLEALFEKVEEVHYPSVEMMARIQRLVAYLPMPRQEDGDARGERSRT